MSGSTVLPMAGPIIKQLMYHRLVTPTFMVAKADVNTKSPMLVREAIKVGSMMAAGSTCLERAIIEFERRFLGSTSEEQLPVSGIVEATDRQRMASFLDLRTIRTLSASDRKKAGSLMKSQAVYRVLCAVAPF